MALGSFSAGLSGLNANATYLSVIGNNLANINTVGYKASSVSFMDLVSQTVGGPSTNPMQIGLGVVTGSISPIFSQGAIENTREATNVVILFQDHDGHATCGQFVAGGEARGTCTDNYDRAWGSRLLSLHRQGDMTQCNSRARYRTVPLAIARISPEIVSLRGDLSRTI